MQLLPISQRLDNVIGDVSILVFWPERARTVREKAYLHVKAMRGGIESGILFRYPVAAQWVVAALVTSPERHGIRDARIPCRAIGVAGFPNYICLRGGELGLALFHVLGRSRRCAPYRGLPM